MGGNEAGGSEMGGSEVGGLVHQSGGAGGRCRRWVTDGSALHCRQVGQVVKVYMTGPNQGSETQRRVIHTLVACLPCVVRVHSQPDHCCRRSSVLTPPNHRPSYVSSARPQPWHRHCCRRHSMRSTKAWYLCPESAQWWGPPTHSLPCALLEQPQPWCCCRCRRHGASCAGWATSAHRQTAHAALGCRLHHGTRCRSSHRWRVPGPRVQRPGWLGPEARRACRTALP